MNPLCPPAATPARPRPAGRLASVLHRLAAAASRWRRRRVERRLLALAAAYDAVQPGYASDLRAGAGVTADEPLAPIRSSPERWRDFGAAAATGRGAAGPLPQACPHAR